MDDNANESVAQWQLAEQTHRACLDHAADLIDAAERVFGEDSPPNIAYHISVLALGNEIPALP